ncbi:MAG: TRAP transporter small permease subunit, partial [Youngiibacter sp.]|nr:TRAP transporter small permease subunit [Youngiibacter sp.]
MNNMKETSNQGSWKVGFSKFVGVLNKTVDALAGIATGSIVITVLIQIIGRLVNNPAPWTEEGTRFIFIWIIFLGIGMGFRKAESARVTIMVGYAPSIVRKLSKWTYT